MAELPIKFENIVDGRTEKLSRRPQIEAYIKSGDVHKNAHVYDLGWRVDPEIRAEWERRFDDKAYIRAIAKDKKMNPLDITINHIVDFWLDELFEIDELEMRANKPNTQGAQKDYLERVANVGKKQAPKAEPKAPAAPKAPVAPKTPSTNTK
jgi:hypothetical protein